MTKITMLLILSFFYTPRFNWMDYLGYGAYFSLIFHGNLGWIPATIGLFFWLVLSTHYQGKYKI